MAQNLKDIFKSMDGQAEAYGMANTGTIGQRLAQGNQQYDYKAPDYLATAPEDQPVAAVSGAEYEEQLRQQDQPQLRAVDGDTVLDESTGTSYRFDGFNTAESTEHGLTKYGSDIDSALAAQKESGLKAKAKMQEFIDNGLFSSEFLQKNSAGKQDVYGRTLIRNDALNEFMVGQGLAAPTDKYDTKLQNMARKYAEKQFNITGEQTVEDKLRESSIDKAPSKGVLDYIGNDVIKSGAVSFATAAASIGDVVLDVITPGDNTFLNDAKDKQKSAKYWGYDDRDYSVDKAEMMHQWDTGRKGEAVRSAILMAPETLISSSGDIAATFVPYLGWAGKYEKGMSLVKASKFIAQKGAGVGVYAAGRSNTLAEEFTANNGGVEPSAGKMTGIFLTQVASASLDRIAFSGAFKAGVGIEGGSYNTTKAVLSDLVGVTNPVTKSAKAWDFIARGSVNVAGGTGKAALAGVGEAVQEPLQEIAEIYATEYGSTKYPKWSDLTRESNKRRLIEASLLGYGAGAGTSSAGSALSGTVQRASSLRGQLAESALDAEFAHKVSYLTPSQRVAASNNLTARIDEVEQSGTRLAEVTQNITAATAPDGTIDFERLATDPDAHDVFKAALLHAINEDVMDKGDQVDASRKVYFENVTSKLLSIVNASPELHESTVNDYVSFAADTVQSHEQSLDGSVTKDSTTVGLDKLMQVASETRGYIQAEVVKLRDSGVEITSEVHEALVAKHQPVLLAAIAGAHADGDMVTLSQLSLAHANATMKQNSNLTVNPQMFDLPSRIEQGVRRNEALIRTTSAMLKAKKKLVDSDPRTNSSELSAKTDTELETLKSALVSVTSESATETAVNTAKIDNINHILDTRKSLAENFGIDYRETGNAHASATGGQSNSKMFSATKKAFTALIDSVTQGTADAVNFKVLEQHVDSVLANVGAMSPTDFNLIKDFSRHVSNLDNAPDTLTQKSKVLFDLVIGMDDSIQIQRVMQEDLSSNADLSTVELETLDVLSNLNHLEFSRLSSVDGMTTAQAEQLMSDLGLDNLKC